MDYQENIDFLDGQLKALFYIVPRLLVDIDRLGGTRRDVLLNDLEKQVALHEAQGILTGKEESVEEVTEAYKKGFAVGIDIIREMSSPRRSPE